MINKKLGLGMFFIFGIVLLISCVLAYSETSYSSYYNNAMGPGTFLTGQSLKMDESMCQQGTDFIMQIGPLGCTPSPVTSDLLEEENVNVFCQLVATQINPFVDVQRIDRIGFQKEYPREVLSMGYQPAQAALGYNPSNLEGTLSLQNLGYIVITLKRQPNESALTNCKKSALGSQVCWVEGNITAHLTYSIQNVFGVGQAVFYLPVMDDEEWQNKYLSYGFWDGRGYLRADSVGDDNAVLSVYSDNTVARGLLTTGRRYDLAEYRSNIKLSTESTEKSLSNKIFLPGLSPCLTSLQFKLEGVVNPDTIAEIKINNDYTEVAESETFLEGKCTILNLEKKGVNSYVQIRCSGADTSEDRKSFYLRMSPKINLSVGGVNKYYEVGDFLYRYQSKDKLLNREGLKDVYLGYVGSVLDSTANENLYAVLIAIPVENKEGNINKLTEDEIASVASYANTETTTLNKIDGLNALIASWAKKNSGRVLTIGKKVVVGEDFILLPYKKLENFQGKDVSLEGFSGGTEDGTFASNANYTNAMSDFDTIIDSYPNEVEKANSIQTLGQDALYKEIILADSVGMKRKLVDLCKEFAKNYPDSHVPQVCTDGLALSNYDIAVKEITVNGVKKRISFGGIKEPSIKDYSAELVVQGPNGDTSLYFLQKNKMVPLDEFRNADDLIKPTTIEYVRLNELDSDSASIKVNVQDLTAKPGSAINPFINPPTTYSDIPLTKGVSQPIPGGWTFTLRNVNLNKVAKVSVVTNRDFAESNSSFKFKIGIEKRLIQLSPDKARQKIIEQNKTIEAEKKISNYLHGVVTAMRGACVATEAILTAKNLAANMNGKAIARQKIMTLDGGWNDVCKKRMEIEPKKYKSLNDCFLANSDQIEMDVDTMTSVINNQNNMIKALEGQTSSNDLNFLKAYSAKVGESLNSLSGKLPPEELEKLKEIIDSEKTESLINKGVYTAEDLRDIQLYALYLNSKSRSGNLESAMIKRLNSTIVNVLINSENSLKQATFEQETGMGENSMIKSLSDAKTENILVKNKVIFVKTRYAQWTIDEAGSTSTIQNSEKDYAYAFQDPNTQLKYLVRYNEDGVVVQTYQIFESISGNGNLVIYRETNKDGTIGKNIPNPFNLRFQPIDATSLKNKYEKSYGDIVPLLTYYESATYKGRVAVIPFNLNEGWYAGISNPATLYDSSGRVNEFYICNVGTDGIESFQITTPAFGGDSCQLIIMSNSKTGSNILGLEAGLSNKLVDQAVNAIEYAQRNYKAGMTKLDGINFNTKEVKVGKPADEISSKECTDLWPVKDCVTLFNVCDPVVCPASRCNLGGKYPVQDVIQSGIIGSIALCYPNAKWNGGDVYVPFCLSGLNAGLEAWISVQEAYVDCLQRNIDTGETVGICDEMHSIYMCEFFWKQSIPVIKLMLPKLIDKIIGQGSKGGGEYQSFSAALKSSQASIDYFTQYYAKNSYRVFQIRSTEQFGTEACGKFASIVYPSSGNFLDNLLSPDSPAQFLGKFEETQITTTTNPPTSHYKVYFHIYAGKDYGAYYKVYLRGSGSSYYQDTIQDRIVKSSYIERGGYADESVDFTAPSGYSQLCINVNGQEECGFKEVSTSFGINYLSDLYLKDQVTDLNITTEKDCKSGTASIYSILDLNAQSAAENLLNPELATQGITRTCATRNPAEGVDKLAGTENARWKQVGYCGDKALKCWIDTDSVKNAIKTLNLKDEALGDVTDASKQYLSTDYYSAADFNAKLNEINAMGITYQQKIDKIKEVFALNKVFYNNQKAQLLLQRGIAYAALAKMEYDAQIAAEAARKAQEDAAAAAAAKEAASIAALDQSEFIEASPDVPCVAGTDYGIMDGYYNGILLKIRVCVISGIDVNSQVAKNTQDLITDAKNAGYDFTNSGGFRNLFEQATLYKDHCNLVAHPECDFKTSANYPSPQTSIQNYYSTCRNLIVDSCKPETAVPGYSDHQMGLAIDFAIGGTSIAANSGAFNWLSQNAYKYGLINYKPEPWHWYFTSGTGSTSGATTTSDEIFVIQYDSSGFFGFPKMTNVYFKYENGKWKWSLITMSNWEATSGTKVTTGTYLGKSPNRAIKDIIIQLNNIKSNGFENGKIIIKSGGGTDMNGFPIYLEAEAAIVNSAGLNVIATEETIFVIQEDISGFFSLGPKMQNIYYTYDGIKWKWSMGSIYNWQDTSTTKVTIGENVGKSPKSVNLEVINKLNYLKSDVFERGKVIIDNAGGTTMNGFSVSSGKPSETESSSVVNEAQFNLNYLSQILIFEDGKMGASLRKSNNLCYVYDGFTPTGSKWHWSYGCSDVSFYDINWYDITDTEKKYSLILGGLTDRNKVFIASLKDKTYLQGLKMLVDRTLADAEGGIINPDLATHNKVTNMDDKGLFDVHLEGKDVFAYKTVMYFRYLESIGWQWSLDKKYWMGVSTNKISGGEFNGQSPTQENLVVISNLKGKDFYQGAAILFDPASVKIRNLFKIEGIGGTPETGGITTGSLEKSFANRDLTKLANLMKSLSTTAYASTFKCYCENNCESYAQWINKYSEQQSIDELLLLAIMIQENSCRSTKSAGGDIGLMQINARVHCGTKGLDDISGSCNSTLLNNNELNINIGAQILKEAYISSEKVFSCGGIPATYSGWEAALRGYNGWGCTGNDNYVEEVKAKYFELVRLYK